MDALLLSRVQFALTTVYHFLFVPVTLGLSIFVALLETGSLVTKTYAMRDRLRKLAKFFGGLFLINFAMGVVTGIVQEFHFGMICVYAILILFTVLAIYQIGRASCRERV